MKHAIIAALGLVLCYGCSTVTMKQPLAQSELTEQERQDMAGTWVGDKTVLYLQFNAQGSPVLAAVEWKNDAFSVNKFDLHITRSGSNSYLSVKDDKSGRYLLAQFHVKDNQALVWAPEVKAFAELIRQGTLHGEAVKDQDSPASEVRIEDPADSVLKVLNASDKLFNYKEPVLILRRIE